MKTCPYCAQQVDDQATRCPYCRNDLGQPAAQAAPPAGPPPPAADPPPPPPPVAPGPPAVVGEGALRFSHSGERYLLGYGEDFFGIWDRNVPGPAVMRFPRTDQGWAEAWGQFAAREPHAVAVPAAGAAQGAPSSAGYRDGHGRATLLMVLLGAMGGIEVITAIVAQGLITQLRAGGLAVVSAVDRAQSLVGLGALLLIVTIVVWCMWEHRAEVNVRALGSSGLQVSPGWSVGWWFVPIANVFMPYRAMSELWRASAPGAGSVEWMRGTTSGLLPLWWAALVVGWVGTQVGNTLVGQSPGPVLTLSDTVVGLRWLLFGQLFMAAAAVLAILVVRETDRRQRERASAGRASAGAV